jgi:nucleoside phosphorylase
VTGVGAERARYALDWLAQRKPSLVVSAGFAGGLAADWHPGEVLLAEVVVDEEGGNWACDLPSHPLLRGGRLLTTRRMVGEPDQKRLLGERFGAAAVDMESAEIARFCAEHELPFGCVRAVSDDVSRRLPPVLLSLLDGGRVSWVRLAGVLAVRPWLIFALARLGRDTKQAARALAQALVQVI